MSPSTNAAGYGTLPNSSSHADEERAALIADPGHASGLGGRLTRHFTATVATKYGDIALLACYVVTGLLDVASVNVWGSFVSMQTGNTVYLGSGIVAPLEDDRWLRALISIACFCLGSYSFSRYHRHFGGRRRWVLVLSYTVQLLCMVIAAILVTTGPQTGPEGPLTAWVGAPIALIAFQSGGQAYISRVLKFGSHTSVVLTSIYLDLFSDANLFAGLTQNAERNRRAAAPLLLLLGAVCGGIWARSASGMIGALWTAVVLKFLVVMAWCLWASEKDGS